MGRYRILVAAVVISAVASAVLLILGSDLALNAVMVLTLAVMAMLIQILLTRPEQRSQTPAMWLLEVNPHAAPALICALAGLVILGSFASEQHWSRSPIFGYGVMLLVFGQSAWLLRLAGFPVRPGGRLRRLVAVTLLAAPTVPYGVVLFGLIVAHGDVAWMSLPYVLPGLFVAPFAALAYCRAFTPTEEAGGN